MLKDCSKPFIVYELLDILSFVFPHVIPMLLLDEVTAATAFLLLNEVNWELKQEAHKRQDAENEDEPEWLRASRVSIESVDEVWKQLFNIYLNQSRYSADRNKSARTLSRIMTDIAWRTFIVNPGNDADILKHRVLLKRYSHAWERIRTQPNLRQVPTRVLWAELLPGMIESICGNEMPPIHDNDYFPCYWVDAKIELLKIIRAGRYYRGLPKQIADSLPKLEDTATQSAFNDFEQFFTRKTAYKWDWNTGEFQNVPRKWSDMDFGIELIDWPVLFDSIGSSALNTFHKSFLRRIRIHDAEAGIYDEENIQSLHRARVYLRIISTAITQLIRSTSKPKVWRDDNLLTTLLAQVLELAKKYNYDHLKNKRFDVLASRWGSRSSDLYREPAMNKVCVALNQLDQEKALAYVKEFFKTNNDLLNLLKAYNSIRHKQVAEFLRKKIEKVDIEKWIRQTNWSTVRAVLVESINNSVHSGISEILLAKYETFVNKVGFSMERTDLFFRLRLIMARDQKDITTIKELDVPHTGLSSSQRKDLEDLKAFYLALCELDSSQNSEPAIALLQEIASRHPKDLDFQFNYYRARMLKALSNVKIEQS